MNERIKELVVESGNGQMRDGRLYPHIGIRFEEDWQRFAELIVREAIEKIESVGFKSSNDIPFETTELFVSQIKQRFGVE